MNVNIEFSELNKTPLYITDDTYNFATCLTLVGRNIENFGATIWTDFLNLLENYANDIPPLNPVEGQLWYDTKNKVLKINKHRHIGYNDWKECVEPYELYDGLLLKSGGLLYVDSNVSNITDDNHIINKKYVDEHCTIKFENSEIPYQYNMDTFDGFITINGRIEQSKIVNGAYEVVLDKNLKDGYVVTLSIDGIYKPNVIVPPVSIEGKSGGSGTTENEYVLNNAKDVSVWYNMFTQPDQMKILINDELFKDTGMVSGSDTIMIPNEKIPASCKLKIIVIGEEGTAWECKLNYTPAPKVVRVEPFVFNHIYYVANKKTNGFTVAVGKEFPDTCNINFNVVGMVAK